MEKLQEFWKRVEQEQRIEMMYAKKNSFRTGQIMMNVLSDMDKNLYSEITTKGDCDPFYSDSKIPSFVNILISAWGE